MALNVGQGIRDRMASQGDKPITDSVWTVNGDGTQVESCLGFKGVYVAANVSGTWESAGPLPVAV